MDNKNDEITIIDILDLIKRYFKYLLSKWVIICIFGFAGALVGLTASFVVKPQYTAHLSFALIEKNSGGGLADLASSFGFAGMIGNNNGAFSGDNLLEIIKSRYAIEKTLLTPITYKKKEKNLVELYIDVYDLQKEWKKNKKVDLSQIKFPIGQSRNTFTRIQDSILLTISNEIIEKKNLTIARKDKKVSIVNVDFRSINEDFSKIFIEQLMKQTYDFYKETKIAQSKSNIQMMQHTADSIKSLYDAALYKSAGISQININQALQYAAVPRIKHERDAQIYGSVYAEVLKNLETLKLDLARETPLVQVIDTPTYPLKKEKLGKVKGIVIGGFLGALLIVSYLIGTLYYKEIFIKKTT